MERLEKVNDSYVYRIRLRGCMAENDLQAIQMLQIFGIRMERGNTTFAISTDQSGLMGFLRQLHGRGLELLSVQCEEPPVVE